MPDCALESTLAITPSGKLQPAPGWWIARGQTPVVACCHQHLVIATGYLVTKETIS